MVSKEDALALIDEIGISPEVKEISRVLIRQKQALNSGEIDNQVAYVISDFQKNITNRIIELTSKSTYQNTNTR